MIRYATLALLLCTLGAAPAWTQPAPKLTYFDQVIDATELIPPPPPVDSEAWQDDLNGVLEAQQNRTDAQVKRALAQKTLSIYLFDEVLGPKFNAQNLPVTDAFFQRMQGDARAVLVAAKNNIQRQRPIAMSKNVLAIGGTPRLPTGYPSGGTVYTTSTAIVLAKMIPEKRFALHERNSEYNQNRVMLGEHFPQDIRVGEIVGTVVTHALMGKPAFVRDFEEARAELRQVLGYPAEPDVVGSVN